MQSLGVSQAEVLAEQLEQVQRDLAVKAEEVLQLHLQLTLLTEQNSICVSQLQNEISSLKVELGSGRPTMALAMNQNGGLMCSVIPPSHECPALGLLLNFQMKYSFGLFHHVLGGTD